MLKIKTFYTNHPWISATLLLAIAGSAWWYFGSKNAKTEIVSITVARGTVSQLVSVTGKVKPASDVDLSFEKGGRVAYVYKQVGSKVGAGEALVSLENGDVSAQLAQARANAKAQAAKLAELKNGARPEDIFVSEVDVENARVEVINGIKSGYVTADDSIRNKVDQMMSNPRSTSPQFNYSLSDSQLKNRIQNERQTAETMLVSWNTRLAELNNAPDVLQYADEAKNNLQIIQNNLDNVALAVNSLQSNSSLSQTTLDAYKAAILAGRTNVTNAMDSLAASVEKLRTAQSKLALKKAGTVKEQIDAQEAEVESAEANVLNLQAQLAKTVIRSPIAGIVTRQDAKRGEIAGAGAVLTSVISDAKYEIEANIAEADIAKIKIGDKAQVTLDAYGNDVIFEASVTSIDPAETVLDGVPTYKTTLQFKENDPRIKSGMTANTDISGERRENVLFIPGRAISGKGAGKTVNLLGNATTTEVMIQTGLRGSNGDVEIISGLNEGDRVKVN
ncbi:MAG: efflux RND transporter periplasmic adaptor subunit [Candidatus Kaiserbacteria bacterium]|nr:efflux RND transporter periplasmic adaptor subunit [Candidatus Kaiserbacteria bacterium]